MKSNGKIASLSCSIELCLIRVHVCRNKMVQRQVYVCIQLALMVLILQGQYESHCLLFNLFVAAQ